MRKTIIIIGAGIIGLSIARLLSKQNYQITIIEKERAGSAASHAAAGMIAAQSEFDTYEPLMDLCLESRDMFPEFVKEIEQESKINVSFKKTGFIRPAFTEDQTKKLQEIYQWQKRKNLEIEFLDKNNLKKIEPTLSDNVQSGLYIKNDAVVNNRKLVEALIQICKKNKVVIKEKTNVENLIARGEEIIGIQVDGKKIEADIVINCAGAWSSHFTETQFGIHPIAGQMISFHNPQNKLKHTIFPCDMKTEPYIVSREEEIIVGATMEQIGFTEKFDQNKLQPLIKKAYQMVPSLKKRKIKETWAGFRPYTNDKLPIIGKTKVNNLFIAAGHGRNGILLAPITARAINELILNSRPVPEIKGFSTDRFPVNLNH